MKIIVLGMDNTGKTTLASRLSQDFNLNYIKSCGPCSKEEQEKFIENFINNENDLVSDRFCLFDEMVYGSVLRGKSNFTLNNKYIDQLKDKITIYYCRPHESVIKKWNGRKQMDGVIDNSDELIQKFDRLIRKLKRKGFNIVKYDYEYDRD